MQEEKVNKVNYVGYLSLLVLVIFLVIAFTVILKPELSVGDDVSLESDPLPIELAILDYTGNNLYLFDETRKNLMVYDNNGNNIANYGFTFSGTVKVTEINEDEEFFIVYYYRIHKYYKVSFAGIIENSIDDDIGYIDEYLNTKNVVDTYKIENNVFWYSVYNGNNLIISRVSLLPIIVLSILVFFSGMLLSRKRKQRQKNDEF